MAPVCRAFLSRTPPLLDDKRPAYYFFVGSLQFGPGLALLPRPASSSSNLPRRPWWSSELPRLGWKQECVVIVWWFCFCFWFWLWLFSGAVASWIDSKCYVEIKQVLYSISLEKNEKEKLKPKAAATASICMSCVASYIYIDKTQVLRRLKRSIQYTKKRCQVITCNDSHAVSYVN